MGQYEIRRRNGTVDEMVRSSSELRHMATDGDLTREDAIRQVGKSTWHSIHTVPGLIKLVPARTMDSDSIHQKATPADPSAKLAGDDSSHHGALEETDMPSEDAHLPMEIPLDASDASDATDASATFATSNEPDAAAMPVVSPTHETVVLTPDEGSSEDFTVEAPGLEPVGATFENLEPEPVDPPVETMPPNEPDDLAVGNLLDAGEASSATIKSGNTAPINPRTERGKETLKMNTLLSGRTQTALYLILGGLLARPLMSALMSLMDNESINGFLSEIGNLAAIGGAGLGVIMLLSTPLRPGKAPTPTMPPSPCSSGSPWSSSSSSCLWC